MSLRIRHVLPKDGHLPSAPGMSKMGGLVTGTLSMCYRQVELGHKVELVGGTSESRKSRHSFSEVSVSRLSMWDWAHFWRWNFGWLGPTWLHSGLSSRVDILHTHVDPNLLLLPKARARILHLRTPVPQPLPKAYQRLLRHADAVVANSNFIRNQFLAAALFPDDHVFTAHNGVDFAHFSHGDGTRFRSKFGVDPASRLLLYVGAVVPEKGVLYLVEAMRIIAKRFPEATLVIIGSSSVWLRSSEYEQTVRELAEGLPIKFLGSVPFSEMPHAYAACDIFILPSIWQEPFGLVLCEAMAAGKPVIASDVGGIPEIVIDGRTGNLIPPGDESSLIEAISALLSDAILRQRMGKAARERAKQFSWEDTVRELDKVYDTVLQEKNARG